MAKNMESQYEGQTFVGANGAPPPAPPFVLEATRSAAVDHIKRYQEVFSGVSPSDSSAAVANPRGYGATIDEDTRVQRTFVKGKLALDISELLGSVSALRETLVAKRNRVCILQAIFAAGLHLVLRISMVAPFAHWMSLTYIHIALYNVRKIQNSISRTTRAREAFEQILKSVHEERRLRQTEIDYVIGTKWDTVPWKEFADSIYFSN